MEYYQQQYDKMKRIFSEGKAYTWNFTKSGRLALFEEGKPFAVMKVKRIAHIDGEKWVWCWKDKHNFIDKKFYPRGLHKASKEWHSSKDPLEKIVKSMEFLNGIWYLYLQESSGLRNVIIITGVHHLYT